MKSLTTHPAFPARRALDAGARIVVTFADEVSPAVPLAIRLRTFLKSALRRADLRVIDIRELPANPPETHAEPRSSPGPTDCRRAIRCVLYVARQPARPARAPILFRTPKLPPRRPLPATPTNRRQGR